MDHFGIGAAMRGMAQVYIQGARRTGRTTSLVESVKDGDRIVFADTREAARVERLCVERGVKVQCIVIPPKEPQQLIERKQPEGRTIFDHGWIEQRYLEVIDREVSLLDKLARETSGFGAPHRETRQAALEISKWSR
jgi:hypothetical protein